MCGMFNSILDSKKRPPNTKPPLPNNIIKTPLLVVIKLACVYASTKYANSFIYHLHISAMVSNHHLPQHDAPMTSNPSSQKISSSVINNYFTL
jgi:hypothetical protein